MSSSSRNRAGTKVALVAFIALVGPVALLMAQNTTGDGGGPGPFSRHTRDALRLASVDRPLYLPVELPIGLDPEASASDFTGPYSIGETERADGESAFLLTRLTEGWEVPEPKRLTLTEYRSSAFDEPDVLYQVVQVAEESPATPTCLRDADQWVEVAAEDTTIRVCSQALEPGSRAWTYWSNVMWSDDLDTIEWLRG